MQPLDAASALAESASGYPLTADELAQLDAELAADVAGENVAGGAGGEGIGGDGIGGDGIAGAAIMELAAASRDVGHFVTVIDAGLARIDREDIDREDFEGLLALRERVAR